MLGDRALQMGVFKHRSRKKKIGRGDVICGQTTKDIAKGKASIVLMDKSTGI